jgi:hypothetical protein
MKAYLLLLLLFLSIQSFAQQLPVDSSFNLTLKTGINRLDFFSGVEGVFNRRQFVFITSLETGINRTFFQQRIFPRASIGFAYRVFHGRLQLEPLAMISQSWLKLSSSENSDHFWTECSLGYRFTIGKKWKFVNEIMGGWMSERFFVETSGVNKAFGTVGYYGSLGLARVIR